MPNKIFLISLCLIFNGINPATAALVHYFDEQGQIHYVDTDYANVPPQYLSQVQEQLEKAEQKTEEQSASPAQKIKKPEVSVEKRPEPEPPSTPSKIVEFYTNQTCGQCPMLEALLKRAKNIKLTVFDVDTVEGQKKYTELGVNNIPVTKIDSTIIVGLEIEKILSALAQSKEK